MDITKAASKPGWKGYIPWFLTIASTITLILVGCFLITNIEWFKKDIFSEHISVRNMPDYRFYAYHLHLSMIKRSVGLFSGFAIMFLGMAVVFYSMKDKITGELKTASVTAAIATTSPGIIAILVGAYLIIGSIQSKDAFPAYNDGGQGTPRQTEPIIPPLPK